LNSPCFLFIKRGLLAAYVAPHRYLSGAAVSPLTSICQQLRPNDASPPC
jgi:hypothetical protein